MPSNWVLQRDLSQVDDLELADLIDKLLSLCSGAHSFDHQDSRRRHEYRLMRCLFERYARGDQLGLDLHGAESK